MNKDEFVKIMESIKTLQEYEVQYILPEDFNFYGVVPFDMSISAGVAYVRLVAPSLEEAVNRVEKYFMNGLNYDE
jgi:hypothetical protein